MTNTNHFQEEGELIDDLELSADIAASIPDLEDNNNNDVVISKAKLLLIKQILGSIRDSHDKLSQLLAGVIDEKLEEKISLGQIEIHKNNPVDAQESGNIVEGVFDGENMIGPDGKTYSIPANYASKSKLIEGDVLKLTITNSGTFVYKQISPVERKREIGMLTQDVKGNYVVTNENGSWRVLTASVTYYKGSVGDEVVVIVPKKSGSRWGSIDNIVKIK